MTKREVRGPAGRGWPGWGTKRAVRRRLLTLVEMAGIEPASEKFDLQTSTSLVDLFRVRLRAPRSTGSAGRYPITPERASLATHIGVGVEHVGLYVVRPNPTDEKAEANGFLV